MTCDFKLITMAYQSGDVNMQPITYLQSCTMFFAPLDEIIEALANNESLYGVSNTELNNMVKSNSQLAFYVNNFDSMVK